MSTLLTLAQALIQIESITPHDGGCQYILHNFLRPLGFSITEIPCQQASNFFAIRGQGKPVVAFAGHTDVVATGDRNAWEYPPFSAIIADNMLHGRGAADMKGSLAAMLTACERFIKKNPTHRGAIAFLITSAEEGPSELGTPHIMQFLQQQQQALDFCIVGEPTADQRVGDTLKNGRRGSLTGELTIIGKQGHIAYPHLAKNPIHECLPALKQLVETEWDHGNDFFQPTSLQYSNIHAGSGQGNVIPGQLQLLFNFRYSPEVTADYLQTQTESLLKQNGLAFNLKWTHYGSPFLTQPGSLIDACQTAIKQHCGLAANISTTGGTSDARYIAPHCNQVIELGPCNATIHQINEKVSLQDLEILSHIYESILQQLLK